MSPRDKRIRYEAEEKKKISGFPTAKELREAKEVAEARLKREEEAPEKVGMVRRHTLSIQGQEMICPGRRSVKRKIRRTRLPRQVLTTHALLTT